MAVDAKQRFGPCPSRQVEIHIDNNSVVKRLWSGLPQDKSINAFIATNYGLWAESMNVLQHVQCTTLITHVKGHQDDFRVKQHKEGPLHQHVFWNVQMDRLASYALDTGTQRPPAPLLKSSHIVVQVKDSTINTKIDQTSGTQC